jgi:predicted nucleotidyltransferase
MTDTDVHRRFSAALDALVAQLQQDRSILAVLLCGSLSHDTVWAKSDIDLAVITIDDRKIEGGSMALYANGVNVHAFVMPRTEFRRLVEGSVQNSFFHSLLTKGRLLYTHDDTIGRLCEGLHEMGARDREVQRLRSAAHAVAALYKARKWLTTRADLDYTALWILYAATPLAEIEVIDAGRLVDREVIPLARSLNPSFFTVIYTDLLNAKKTKSSVTAALAAAERYLEERTERLFALVLAYLRDAGEARGGGEIEAHFKRHFDVDDAVTACEYLADRGLVGKVSLTARLTRKSNIDVQELAFVYLGE